MSEPRTEAGKRLLDMMPYWKNSAHRTNEEVVEHILAIEAEAAAPDGLRELRALSDAATPGRWLAGVEAEGWHSREYWRVPIGPGKIGATHTEADADYIAALVNWHRLALRDQLAAKPGEEG